LSVTVKIEEDDRQMILLALAELALSRPGWDSLLSKIAGELEGVEMFAEFKRLNADRVRAERSHLGWPPDGQVEA
jgi:hypothetical protein